MKNSRMLRGIWLIQIALIPALVVTALAQRGGGSRPNPDATRRTINDETFRELMNRERENKNLGRNNSETAEALLKQTSDDFKAIQISERDFILDPGQALF